MFMSNELDIEPFVDEALYWIMRYKPNIVPFDRWEIQFSYLMDLMEFPEDEKIRFLFNMVESCVWDKLIEKTYPVNLMIFSYEDIVSILGCVYREVPDHPILLVNFSTRLQKEDECVRIYYVALQILAGLCNFGFSRTRNIRIQFIAGLRNKNIRCHLLLTDNKDLEDVVSIAEQMESEEFHDDLEFDEYD
ncbi:hypothetical protein M0802_011136 [Mischocyttarus mexicanus]|nr:hypothetical protein M0802_011136 [Mischocyttarus mexicanus]